MLDNLLLGLSLLSAFFFVCTVKCYLPIPARWRELVLFVAALFLTTPPIWFGDAANILFVGAALFVAIPLLCKGMLLARLSVTLLLFCAIISTQAIFSQIRPPVDRYIILLPGLVWLCIFLISRRFIKPDFTEIIPSRLWLLLDALALLPVTMTTVIVLLTQSMRTFATDDPHTDSIIIGNERVLLILLALSAVYSVGLLLFVVLLAKQARMEQKQMLWAIRQQYYANLEQSQLQVRRLRHDLANHLSAMAGMEEHTLRGYLAQLIAAPAMAGGRRFCDNEIVNAVLSVKLPTIEQEAIEAEIRLTVPSKLPISDIDLCALFSNCIDNAVEACRKCPQKSRRILLTAKTEKGIFALYLKNSMTGRLETKHGRLITSKPDKENHGLGMAEIQDIVQKHEGVIKHWTAEDSFHIQISIPFLI